MLSASASHASAVCSPSFGVARDVYVTGTLEGVLTPGGTCAALTSAAAGGGYTDIFVLQLAGVAAVQRLDCVAGAAGLAGVPLGLCRMGQVESPLGDPPQDLRTGFASGFGTPAMEDILGPSIAKAPYHSKHYNACRYNRQRPTKCRLGRQQLWDSIEPGGVVLSQLTDLLRQRAEYALSSFS